MIDWYALVVKYFNFPAGLYFKGQGRFYRHYRALEKNQWLSSDAVAQLQWKRLNELLSRVFASSPYWRSIFRRLGAVPKDVNSLDDFRRLPLMTKAILQEQLDEMTGASLNREGVVKNASGGSTGEPTIFYQDKERNYRRAMDQIRHDRWSGWEIGEKVALLWGARSEFKKYERISEYLNNALFFRRFPLDAFNLTEDKMRDYLEFLKFKRPTIIQAYAQAIALFAQFIKRSGLGVKPLSLKGIIVSAEKLYSWQRDLIETVFGCKVFDRYGSREVGLVASECDRFEGMHINDDNVLVEFIRGDGAPCRAGELGKIIVTDLWNFITPFIRYDTGDIGALLKQRCSCGRGLRLMRHVEGRTADFIRLPDGRQIHGEYFTHLFYGVPGVKQFQLVQSSPEKIVIKIVKTRGFSSESIAVILGQISGFIKNQRVKVFVEYVDDILIPVSGKHRFTMSNLISQ